MSDAHAAVTAKPTRVRFSDQVAVHAFVHDKEERSRFPVDPKHRSRKKRNSTGGLDIMDIDDSKMFHDLNILLGIESRPQLDD